MARITMTHSDWARLDAILAKALQSVADNTEEAELLRALAFKLERARVTPELAANHVSIGPRVTARSLNDGELLEFSIVLPEDADWSEGRISVLAPLAAAFLGRAVGDHVLVRAPHGAETWVVESVGSEVPALV